MDNLVLFTIIYYPEEILMFFFLINLYQGNKIVIRVNDLVAKAIEEYQTFLHLLGY